MGKKKTEIIEGEEYTVVEPAPAAEVEAEETTAKKRGRKPKGEMTLSELADKYLAHMEESGKSSGTCFSYRLEMATAINALGAETKVAELTPEQVMLFFGSDRVQKKKNGKAKSPLSIAKTQRVLRLALQWAENTRVIEKAPLPEDATTH